jgi:peptidyl-dipeptidase A
MKKLLLGALLIILTIGCRQNSNMKTEVQSYLDQYNLKYKELYTASSEGQWKVNTMIKAGDSTNAKAAQKADEAFAEFTGSKENIDKATKYLQSKSALDELQIKQLDKILYLAGNNPQTLKDKVKARIKAETAQTEKLFGYPFKIDGKPVTTNKIDSILGAENNLDKRKAAWEASKEVGRELKDGLAGLQALRNETVKGLGYPDFFTYQVSEYGMTTQEMMDLNHKFIQEVWPLYRELHTYARYELAKKYNSKEVPEMLPAHWLGNRWGQDWSSMITVKGLNLDSILEKKSAEWIVKKGEEFYVSLGFDPLPQTFWDKSSLYPLPANSPYKKNNHASAWHIDFDKDVRSLMSVEPNAEWYQTVNHELGHIYYYRTYSKGCSLPSAGGCKQSIS